MKTALSATKVLIGINVLVYLCVNVLLPALEDLWALLPLYYPDNAMFRPWQFLTHMFMHGSTGHLFFNMFALFSFGTVLERIWGAKRFVIFYLVVGLGAGLIYTGVNQWEVRADQRILEGAGYRVEQVEAALALTNPQAYAMRMLDVNPLAFQAAGLETLREIYRTVHVPVVGASGAIYGILTAFGLLFPNAKLSLLFLPVPVAAKFFIPGLLVMDLFSGVTGVSLFGGGIAHFAHVGGAVIGFALMMLWKKELSGIDLQVRFE